MNSYIYLDEEELYHVNVYEHKDGGLCRYYRLEGDLFKQVAAYSSILKDLIECKEAVEYLKTIYQIPVIPQTVKSSLIFSSIVKYAKCYTSGKGRGTTLNSKDVFKNEKAKYLDFHDKTMDIRHNYLAHAGNSALESRAMILILHPDETKKAIEKIVYAGMNLKDDDSNIDNYLSLIDTVISHVSEKIESLRGIMSREIKKLDINEIYSKSKIPDKEKLIPFRVNEINKIEK